jgi:hypothetical protein
MEMLVRLTTPEALHGVLSVLHARRVQVDHLRYDGRTLRVGVTAPPPQLVAQVSRRVDVLSVDVAQVRCAEPSSARRQPGLWATSHG